MIDRKKLHDSLILACDWLTNTAQWKAPVLPDEFNRTGLKHNDWTGAIRGEYFADGRQWDMYCPVWHTGQAVKSLVWAWRVLQNDSLLDAAVTSANFISGCAEKLPGGEEAGMIKAYEEKPGEINISAILESLDGLFTFSKAMENRSWAKTACNALEWVARKAYIGDGLFRYVYDAEKKTFRNMADPKWCVGTPPEGRPLLDDAAFLKGWICNGNNVFRRIFYETAQRLLQDENPRGNWIKYAPANEVKGFIHPRHAYWWGMPMIDAYLDSKEDVYRQCALRSGWWYADALRRDGGMIRNTYLDFNTNSFGHATSGSACAAILMLRLKKEFGETCFNQHINSALNFCMKMQLRDVKDENMRGAVLEKVLDPNGTDRHPYHIRDLGTIFFIQAASLYSEML